MTDSRIHHSRSLSRRRLMLQCGATLASLAAPSLHAMSKPSFHTQGKPTGKPTGTLKPGEYWWAPVISPTGPVVVVVSIPLQTMHVYRNGILIGRSTISSGAPGRSTPSGVFTILEKKVSHRSKKYQNAPMPNMQRLTWSGIAMHSGQLPGYPASHGCVRMPYDFSKLLYSVTSNGGTVIIGDLKKTQPRLAASPGLMLAPTDFTPEMLRPLADNEYDWRPERSPMGPITILASAADRALYVYRNGEPIGRAAIAVSDKLGGHVFSMLDGVIEKKSWWAPNRPARRWQQVATDEDGKDISFDDLGERVRVNPEFAAKLYDELTPGATIVVTDQPAARKPSKDFTILTNL
jgi:lipoprotein-anchoring transpeptidase ErfK/SrfK